MPTCRELAHCALTKMKDEKPKGTTLSSRMCLDARNSTTWTRHRGMSLTMIVRGLIYLSYILRWSLSITQIVTEIFRKIFPWLINQISDHILYCVFLYLNIKVLICKNEIVFLEIVSINKWVCVINIREVTLD